MLGYFVASYIIYIKVSHAAKFFSGYYSLKMDVAQRPKLQKNEYLISSQFSNMYLVADHVTNLDDVTLHLIIQNFNCLENNNTTVVV